MAVFGTSVCPRSHNCVSEERRPISDTGAQVLAFRPSFQRLYLCLKINALCVSQTVRACPFTGWTGQTGLSAPAAPAASSLTLQRMRSTRKM